MSVRGHLVALLALATVSMAALIVFAYRTDVTAAHRDASASNVRSAERSAGTLRRSLKDGQQSVLSLAAQPGLSKAFSTPVGACQLSTSALGPFAVTRIDLVRPDGQVICSSDPSVLARGKPHQALAWLATTLRGREALVSWRVADWISGADAVVVSAPVPGTARGASGVVALTLGLSGLPRAMDTDLVPAPGQSWTIVEAATGRVLATSESTTPPAVLATRWPATGEWTGLDGRRRLYRSADVGGGVRMYASLPLSRISATARTKAMDEALYALAGLAVFAGLVWLLDRRVAGPLRAATSAAAEAAWSPEARVPERGAAEVVSLARALNEMLELRSASEQQNQYRLDHDHVTGLPSRSAVAAYLDALLAEPGVTGATLLKLGIHRFKLINDTYGRSAGDVSLLRLAERLRAVLKDDEQLVRGDGDNFVVLVKGTRPDLQRELAQRVLAVAAIPQEWNGHSIVLRCAAGLASAGPDAVAGQLLRRADRALRQAMAQDDDWQLFDETTHTDPGFELAMEEALRHGVTSGEIRVHYQPLVDITTGRLRGAEALVRWERPGIGLVPPLEFLPLAEATGLIVDIGALVLAESCAQARIWADAGAHLRVSVNVAARQLREPGFVDLVRTTLRATALEPTALCLELTESAVVSASGLEAAALMTLRREGVQVSIDDFGTGFSSLAYLRDLPVTELKVDRAFTARVTDSTRDLSLVEGMLRMAEALGLDVVIEGVETPQQLQTLRRFGSLTAQGWLFSRPLPTADMLELVLRERDGSALIGAGVRSIS